MSQPNAFISNGTCYVGPGERAADVFFPCGNAALGHKTCCGMGDMCLSSRACYNQQFGLTYLLGCSDPNFSDPSCPSKGTPASPWAGLVYCNGTSNQWVACPQRAKETTLATADACFCPSTSRTVAFTDRSVLANVVSLPTAPGQSVVWQAGYVPTAADPPPSSSSPTGSPTSGSPSSTSGAPAPTSPPGNDPSVPEPGLSTTAKVGIGVGIGIGGTLLIVALAFFIFRHRRRSRKASLGDDGANAAVASHGGKSPPGPTDPYSAVPGTPATPATLAPSELDSTAARPWSMRSELQSTGTPTSLAEKQQMGAIRDARIPDGGLHPSSLENSPRPGVTPPGGRGPLSPVAELPG